MQLRILIQAELQIETRNIMKNKTTNNIKYLLNLLKLFLSFHITCFSPIYICINELNLLGQNLI